MEAIAVRPCTECDNEAREGRALCYCCTKRRQRGSRRRQPHYASPWERLVAAALRYAEAEGDEEYVRAEAVLRMAARHYTHRTPAQLPLFETCPPP